MRMAPSVLSKLPAPANWPDQWGPRILAAGWMLFIAAFFLGPDKHSLRTIYYALVVVPALIWSRALIRQINWRDPLWLSFASAVLFLSMSALWGADADSGHALKAVKVTLFLTTLFLVARFLVQGGLLPFRLLTASILTLAVIVATASLVYNLYTILTASERPGLEYMRLAGLGSQMNNPLIYAGIMGCGGLLALSEFFRETRRPHQILLLLVIALLTLSLVLTMSRGAMIYFVAMSAMIAAVHFRQWRRTLLLLLLALLAAMPILLSPGKQSALQTNVTRPSYRPLIWSAVIAETRGQELFGQGWPRDESLNTPEGRFGHSHNFVLGAYRFGGVIGLALFITLIGLLLYRCTQLRRDIAVPLGAWLLFGICLHLTNGRFPVSAPGHDWFYFWLPAALVYAFDQPDFHRQK